MNGGQWLVTVVELKSSSLTARLSTRGGIVLGLWWERDGMRAPLLREAPSDDADAHSCGCYPLVPFGNRVKGNRFTFRGKDYAFEPNTPWDPHYVHGEGWQSEWAVLSQYGNEAEFSFSHEGRGTPYAYEARQRFIIYDDRFDINLQVRNLGPEALPFGLGWHPYFPMTPTTTLNAPAKRYWTEVEGWLAGEAADIPSDLDFATARVLPHRWINNGFEGWNGFAEIAWPEHRMRLRLTADERLRHYFIFVSDNGFDPDFRRDYFCFEPMSHLANGHNLPDLGNLTILEPGERMTVSLQLHPEAIA
ncbi:aldose 1-epimerase [Rhizobium calliandrae]|uniref:Aldose 1-epimerase n=1 Tax=Rhizobium calliandrae TaxID=1312182 RepID=A0ABT7KF04_9HYPH|nr:aldose 1-epimerase [Rhizobium calliandrae]MDL2407189.1 aldose 1-epimerase [Rhizobium calliandrae]